MSGRNLRRSFIEALSLVVGPFDADRPSDSLNFVGSRSNRSAPIDQQRVPTHLLHGNLAADRRHEFREIELVVIVRSSQQRRCQVDLLNVLRSIVDRRVLLLVMALPGNCDLDVARMDLFAYSVVQNIGRV